MSIPYTYIPHPDTISVPVGKLDGWALDWAVSMTSGQEPWMLHNYFRDKARRHNARQEDLDFHLSVNKNRPVVVYFDEPYQNGYTRNVAPYNDPDVTMKLLDENPRIFIKARTDLGERCAGVEIEEVRHFYYARTAALAVARAYVYLMHGPFIDIPKEIL